MSDQWSDLRTRINSAIALMLIALLALWGGSFTFGIFIAIVGGIMQWELSRICAPRTPLLPFLYGLVSCLLAGMALVPSLISLSDLSIPNISLLAFVAIACIAVMARFQNRERFYYFVYSICIILTCWGCIILFRNTAVIVLLIAIVISVDVAGYFVGKIVGGKKFWPAISPKKTWSGIIGGWVAAFIVAIIIAQMANIYTFLIIASPLIAFSAQLGDIAESALKRRAGVKDSSNLIPGHGGFLDRFDGVIGGATGLILIMSIGYLFDLMTNYNAY